MAVTESSYQSSDGCEGKRTAWDLLHSADIEAKFDC